MINHSSTYWKLFSSIYSALSKIS